MTENDTVAIAFEAGTSVARARQMEYNADLYMSLDFETPMRRRWARECAVVEMHSAQARWMDAVLCMLCAFGGVS